MQQRHVSYLLILLLSLLVDLSGNSKVHAALPAPGQAEPSESYRYFTQIKQAITTEFPDTKSYEGKECTVRISIAQDGLLLRAESVSGDPELCKVAVSAAARTKFPSAPSHDIWQRFKNITMVFSP